MLSKVRQKIEYQIVGSCLMEPSNLAVVTQYITIRNLADNDAILVMSWMANNPDVHLNAGSHLLGEIRKKTGIKAIVLARMMMAGSNFLPLVSACLYLLEHCFRAEAVRILKTNRDKVLIPLAPLEKDIENPENDVWQMITAAGNYCSDVGLPELAEQLTQLLMQMDQRAGALLDSKRAGLLIHNLRAMAHQEPAKMKPFVNVLNEIINAAG
jgi:hypothetical protein